MFNKRTILALIPARAGSKGLPGKNKKLFCGRPLIWWSIEAAKKSKYTDKIIISTDDADIEKIAEECVSDSLFKRAAKLATDTATAIDVILDVREALIARNEKYDIIVYLQPTSPLRTAEDIDKGIEFFFNSKSDSVVGVCKSAKPKYFIGTLPADNNMSSFITTENANKNRQQYEDFFQINGALYISTLDRIYNEKSWYGNNTLAYIMPESRSVDIDTELDFSIAEFMLKSGLSKQRFTK